MLHVLARAGVDVEWRDNQSGCKGVCAGLPFESFADRTTAGLCAGGRCFDEILLEGLAERIARSSGDLLIVLHLLGNHGPAYYQRYPPTFRRFEPTCDTTDVGACERQALINTYDNAILYTDHVLGLTLDILGAVTTHDAALIYVSDHGESLGEHNLYLHGVPHAIAPSEQTHVPLVAWFAAGTAPALGLDLDCLRRRATEPASHDDLFHTALGLFDVGTVAYDRAYDLTAGCRPTPGSPAPP
jgi:lipid A ethanolaminephosphotransferase